MLPLSSDDDVGDNKVNDFNFTSSLISAIKVRRPLFDHRMVSSKKSELIKNKLWNEVYTELQGERKYYNFDIPTFIKINKCININLCPRIILYF